MPHKVLTPGLAKFNKWTISAHCDKCRTMKLMDLAALCRRNPDLNLEEALLRGKLKCSKCRFPCSGLNVSGLRSGGLSYSVMKLTPGLKIERDEEAD